MDGVEEAVGGAMDEIIDVNKSKIVRRFVPRAVIERFEKTGQLFKNRAEVQDALGVVAFFDISGFSTLANQLETSEKNKRQQKNKIGQTYNPGLGVSSRGTGAEELARLLNDTLTSVVNFIMQSGGDIIKFAGDALIVVWTSSPSDLAAMVAVACHCALKCTLLTLDSETSLRMHTGVGCGQILMCHVGGQRDRWEFFIAGDANTQGASAEGASDKDQVVASGPALQKMLGLVKRKGIDLVHEMLKPKPPKDGDKVKDTGAPPRTSFAHIQRVVLYHDVCHFPSKADLVMLSNVEMKARVLHLAKAYIPRPVMQMIETETASINELRKVTVIFFRLTDVLEDASATPRSAASPPKDVGIEDKELGHDQDEASSMFSEAKDPATPVGTDDCVDGNDDRSEQVDEAAVRQRQIMFLNGIQKRVKAVQQAAYSQWGTLRQFIIDDKGCVAIVVIGLPPLYFEDNAARAVKVAAHLIERLKIQAVAGICTGHVFCGAIGSQFRAEYSVTGDCINLAARLMNKAAKNSVLVDAQTAKEASSNPWIRFTEKPGMNVKGYTKQVRSFIPDLVSVAQGKAQMPETLPALGGVGSVRIADSDKHFKRQPSSATETTAIGQGEVKSDICRAVFLDKERPCKVVLLEGKPGSGKSQILHWALGVSSNSAKHVFYSVADASESKTAFYVWRPIILEMLKLDLQGTASAQSDASEEGGASSTGGTAGGSAAAAAASAELLDGAASPGLTAASAAASTSPPGSTALEGPVEEPHKQMLPKAGSSSQTKRHSLRSLSLFGKSSTPASGDRPLSPTSAMTIGATDADTSQSGYHFSSDDNIKVGTTGKRGSFLSLTRSQSTDKRRFSSGKPGSGFLGRGAVHRTKSFQGSVDTEANSPSSMMMTAEVVNSVAPLEVGGDLKGTQGADGAQDGGSASNTTTGIVGDDGRSSLSSSMLPRVDHLGDASAAAAEGGQHHVGAADAIQRQSSIGSPSGGGGTLSKLSQKFNSLQRSLSMGAPEGGLLRPRKKSPIPLSRTVPPIEPPPPPTSEPPVLAAALNRPAPINTSHDQDMGPPVVDDAHGPLGTGARTFLRSAGVKRAASPNSTQSSLPDDDGFVPPTDTLRSLSSSASCNNLESLPRTNSGLRVLEYPSNSGSGTPSSLTSPRLLQAPKRHRAHSTASNSQQQPFTNPPTVGGRFLQLSTQSGDHHIAEQGLMLQRLREKGRVQNRRLSTLGQILPGYFFANHPDGATSLVGVPGVDRGRTTSDSSESSVFSNIITSTTQSMIRLMYDPANPNTTASSPARRSVTHSQDDVLNSGEAASMQHGIDTGELLQSQSPMLGPGSGGHHVRRFSGPALTSLRAQDREEIMELVLDMLEETGKLGETLIVIDDAHNMDDDSWELLIRAVQQGRFEVEAAQDQAIQKTSESGDGARDGADVDAGADGAADLETQQQQQQQQQVESTWQLGMRPASDNGDEDDERSTASATLALVGPNVRFLISYRPQSHTETVNYHWKQLLEICYRENERCRAQEARFRPNPEDGLFDSRDFTPLEDTMVDELLGTSPRKPQRPPWGKVSVIRPLTLRESADLLSLQRGVGVGSDLLQFLFGATKGNPGYLMNLFNSLVEQEYVKVDPNTQVAHVMEGLKQMPSESVLQMSLPGHFVADVYRRFDAINKNVQLILKLASSIGKLVPIRLLFFLYAKRSKLISPGSSEILVPKQTKSGSKPNSGRGRRGYDDDSNLEITSSDAEDGSGSGSGDNDAESADSPAGAATSEQGESARAQVSGDLRPRVDAQADSGARKQSGSALKERKSSAPALFRRASSLKKRKSSKFFTSSSSSAAPSDSPVATDELSNQLEAELELDEDAARTPPSQEVLIMLRNEFNAGLDRLKELSFIAEQAPASLQLSPASRNIVFKDDSERCVIYNMMLNTDKRRIHEYILEWYENEEEVYEHVTCYDIGLYGYHAMLSEQHLKAFTYFELGIRDSFKLVDKDSVEAFTFSLKEIIDGTVMEEEVRTNKHPNTDSRRILTWYRCRMYKWMAHFYIMIRSWNEARAYLRLAIHLGRTASFELGKRSVSSRVALFFRLRIWSKPRSSTWMLSRFATLRDEDFLNESQRIGTQAKYLMKKLKRMQQREEADIKRLDAAVARVS
ncbi:Adenylate cyclase type 10 (AH-related protein) (Adenylate cyclase homolog) (Germ cell soluble adenylyl cyclase) (hsAC) (sAC) (Testicular soluble adenylyl cyclase) [Durusdinium trenchii]|uniref:Adenylate cyclase type 10 (AH-related protein) (Adenylate cyclase homolog) (Germ cell soluble adenylyl cyclase) (HsAC) (SAC) (Testicular soluble adenylyl cyclase) n=1 Tax=Durusdinium trenchii TaxID=1381693 RepID=A0ABP0P658_9DINO